MVSERVGRKASLGPPPGPLDARQRPAMLLLTCDKGAQRTHKEVRDLIRRLREQGFEVVDKGVAHPKVYKDGQLLTTLPSTPSDVRSLKNAAGKLRRHGYRG